MTVRRASDRLRTAVAARRGRGRALLIAGPAILAGAGLILAVTTLNGTSSTDRPARAASTDRVAPPVVMRGTAGEVMRVSAGSEIATGFVVSRNRIVTVAHALARPLAVDGRPARILRVNRRTDLALIRVLGLSSAEEPDPALPPAARAAAGSGPRLAGPVAAGERVRVLGLRRSHAVSLPGRVRRAIVAHVRVQGARPVTRPALELAARLLPGDSGAPVITESGAVVGVVFAASSRSEGTAYAVDVSALARLLGRR